MHNPFTAYLADPVTRHREGWVGPNPHPDYLSSSRKRLAPQLVSKGGIVNGWGKKIAIALHAGFFATLPSLETVPVEESDLALFSESLDMDAASQRYRLSRSAVVYTRFATALSRITVPEAGERGLFEEVLQQRLRRALRRAGQTER